MCNGDTCTEILKIVFISTLVKKELFSTYLDWFSHMVFSVTSAFSLNICRKSEL